MVQVHGLQWDSVDRLPFTPPLQAFYVNGSAAVTPHFGRGRVYIDVNGTAPDKAFWRDIEPGDGTPAGFGGWLDRRHAAVGSWGGGYCDRDQLAGMITSAGRRPWSLWLATLEGTFDPAATGALLASLPPNVTLVAVQAFGARHLGFNADLSVVIDPAYWQKRALR